MTYIFLHTDSSVNEVSHKFFF